MTHKQVEGIHVARRNYFQQLEGTTKMNDFKQYPTNLWIWAKRLYTVKEWYREDKIQFTFKKKAKFYFFWIIDVLPNTLTGGDPEESMSSRFQKDRHAWVPGFLISLINAFAGQSHGERSLNPFYGEGGINRELSNPGQVFVTILWIILVLVGAIKLFS